jgi:transcriptional regulator with XRE-family HTH domain
VHYNVAAFEAVMNEQHWTAAQLARELGVTRTTISRILRHQRTKVSGAVLCGLQRLCERLGSYELSSFYICDDTK